jgi:hypothetical protein
MAWYLEHRGVRLACAAALAAWLGLREARADAEADRWFARHPEQLWQPLAQKFGEAKAGMKTPVENLTLPLDYHANGRVRAVLRAAKSQMLGEGLIIAQEVTVDMMNEEGKPDGRLTAEGCLFDRNAKHGYCEGLVTVVKGTDRIKGRDMYFSIENQFIKILSECEIRTSRIPLKVGRLS